MLACWLRGKFSEDLLASWTVPQTEYSIDQTERRANRLLTDQQAPFTEWVTEFLPSYWQQESTLNESAATR